MERHNWDNEQQQATKGERVEEAVQHKHVGVTVCECHGEMGGEKMGTKGHGEHMESPLKDQLVENCVGFREDLKDFFVKQCGELNKNVHKKWD